MVHHVQSAVLCPRGHWTLYYIFCIYFLQASPTFVHIVQSTWAWPRVCCTYLYIQIYLAPNKRLGATGPNGPLQPPNCFFFTYLTFEQERMDCGDPWSTFNPLLRVFYPVTCHVDCFYPSNPQFVSISLSPVHLYRITCTCIFYAFLGALCSGTFLKKTHSG